MCDFNDVDIFEQDVVNSRGQHFKIAVLRGGFTQEYPKEYMDNVVLQYTRNCLHNQFVESHLDLPWVRIVLTGINDLDYETFNNHHLDGNE